MKKLIILTALLATFCFGENLSYTTAELNNILEMASDQTAMQTRDFTNSVTTAGVTLTFADANASITSGEFTTVATNGVITIGRAGVFRLRIIGSMEATSAVAPMELRVYLDIGAGYVDTHFGVVRDIANNDHGSFASEFHGARAIGDKIKIMQFSTVTCDFIFNSV